jgi:predicted AAA+ superfamily ATPase
MKTPYKDRVMDGILQQRLRSSGAVLLEGPKACGKTSTAEQVTKSQVYLDIDEAARAALEVDPALVLTKSTPQLIDEWQINATRVWNWVRTEVNRRGKPGQFVLTGSAVPIDDVRRHTGAGRIARLRMRPMSLFESGESTGAMSLAALLDGQHPASPESLLSVDEVAGLVVRGGWPLNLTMTNPDAAQANVDYLRNIAEVDIQRVGGARRDPARVQRFLQALARNVAMEQKVARLAAETDGVDGQIARTTAYDILSILEQLMVVEAQPPFATHLRSRATLNKAPRTHFVDPSLAVAALQASKEQLLADLKTFGLLFESLVIRDLRIYADPVGGTVQHYRDSDGLEVDAVVQTSSGTWGAFEIKLGTGQIDAAAKTLTDFAAKVATEKVGVPAVLAIITASGYGYTRPSDGIIVIPIGALGP